MQSENLNRIFGIENVSNSEIDKITYASDASTEKGIMSFVIYPKNKEQIREFIKSQIRLKQYDIIPRGAGTGLSGAVVPRDSIILDFQKMNKILEINTEEKYVIVEPGVVLKELNKKLSKKNLFFPVVPSSEKVCTIGGMIACNAEGNRAVKYGKTSNWILELEIINGKGCEIKLDEKKSKEFAGSEGTAGIITKAKLKLTEDIKKTTLSVFNFEYSSELIEKLISLEDEKGIIAVEFFDKLSAKFSGFDEKITLIVEYENNEGIIKNPEEIRKIWEKRESAYPSLVKNGYSIIEDPRIEQDKLKVFLDFLTENEIPVFGHIKTGILHPMFKSDEKDKIRSMYNTVNQLKGEISGEHGYGISKKEYTPINVKIRISKLKKEYDSYNIFNRGKIL